MNEPEFVKDAEGKSREVIFKSEVLEMDKRGFGGAHAEHFSDWMNEGGAETLTELGVSMEALSEANGGELGQVFILLSQRYGIGAVAVAEYGKSTIYLLKKYEERN